MSSIAGSSSRLTSAMCELANLAFISGALVILLLGPPRVSKTHLAAALEFGLSNGVLSSAA